MRERSCPSAGSSSDALHIAVPHEGLFEAIHMDKIMAFGGLVFTFFTICAATMTPPAAMAHAGRPTVAERRNHVIEVPTIEIVGRVQRVTVLPTEYIYGRVPSTDDLVVAELARTTGLDETYVASVYNDDRYGEVYVEDGALIAIDR